jgi:hypothetical protein
MNDTKHFSDGQKHVQVIVGGDVWHEDVVLRGKIDAPIVDLSVEQVGKALGNPVELHVLAVAIGVDGLLI